MDVASLNIPHKQYGHSRNRKLSTKKLSKSTATHISRGSSSTSILGSQGSPKGASHRKNCVGHVYKFAVSTYSHKIFIPEVQLRSTKISRVWRQQTSDWGRPPLRTSPSYCCVSHWVCVCRRKRVSVCTKVVQIIATTTWQLTVTHQQHHWHTRAAQYILGHHTAA